MIIFEESAHIAYLGETNWYLEVVADFMRNIETPKL